MKKVISLLMVLALACLLCVPAFAANTYNKSDVQAKMGEVPAEFRAQAQSVLDAMDNTITVKDPGAVKAAATNLQNTLAGAKDAAAVEAAVNGLKDAVNANVSDVNVAAVSVNVDVFTGKVTLAATVSVTKDGVTTPVSVSAETKAAQIYWTDSSKKTSATVAATTAGVIKATGFDSTSLVLVVLAVAGILSVATVKARKLG